MRTLQVALRVSDLDASIAFYRALGYEFVGEVTDTPIGQLTMMKLPGDEFVSVELVHDPSAPPPGETSLSHLAVQVESLVDTVGRLAGSGIAAAPIQSPGPGLHTTTITDPDGRRIELVQWPPGHAEGMTAADWKQDEEDR
jgi:lactoylglutathione lyase